MRDCVRANGGQKICAGVVRGSGTRGLGLAGCGSSQAEREKKANPKQEEG